jgi:hypothetical protein
VNALIPALGVPSLAVFVTALLIVGTRENKTGPLKPLPWGLVLFLSLLAGALYVAAGWPFNIVPQLVMGDLLGLVTAFKPGIKVPALALVLLAVIGWVGLTRRQMAVAGIVLFYLLAGSSGGLGTFAQSIHDAAWKLAG